MARRSILFRTNHLKIAQALLEMSASDEERGLGDMPYPPNYPKMPGEPKRVQPSRDTDLKRENKRT